MLTECTTVSIIGFYLYCPLIFNPPIDFYVREYMSEKYTSSQIRYAPKRCDTNDTLG